MLIDVDFMYKCWPLIMGLIFVLVWCIRQEGKIEYLQQDHLNHKNETKQDKISTWEKLDSIQISLIEMVKSLAKIEGKLESKD